MPKRRGPSERKRLDPDDVLAGRVKVSAAELLDLIHWVNPTGRELGAREDALRYAQKSRLQSLLVRRFGEELDIVADPEREGTVSLLHRGHGRDGCHAVVDSLDEDARARVRLELDLGPPSSEAAPAPAARPSGRGQARSVEEEHRGPPSEQASPESLVGRAEEATAAYDYERARALLTRAVAVSGGAAGPAAALLLLLVETLGDDAAALALHASGLSHAALGHPEVRALLALAAARSGDVAEATALLRGAGEERQVPVVAALAGRAAAAGDAEGAAAHLAELRRRDPAHPAIAALGEDVARLRAAARAPAEAEIAAFVVAGQGDEAERKAAEVLARWPESEAARKVIRAAGERRRTAQEAELRRAREAEAALAARQEAARVEEVRALLAAPDPRAGLLAFLDLDPSHRRALGEAGAEAIRWLDLMPERAPPRARVDAALALGEAHRDLASDPAGALDALAPHADLLERVPEAKRIAEQAKAAIAARRVAAARREVAEARREMAQGEAAAALARLDRPVLRDLPEADRAEAEALVAEATGVVVRETRVADAGRLRQKGQLFEARALAADLFAESTGDERRRWEEEGRAIEAEIQRSFAVEVDHTPCALGDRPSPGPTQTMMESPLWLTGDGRTLVLAEGRDRWLWVQLVDVATRSIRAEAVLRAPEPMGNVYVTVLGHTAWLTGESGALLALDVERMVVLLFRSASDLLPTGYRTGQVLVLPDPAAPEAGGRFYWITPADAEGRGGEAWVFDLQQGRVVRKVPDLLRISALAGVPGERVARYKLGPPGEPGSVIVHEARGPAVPGGRVAPYPDGPVITAVHPSGEGLVILINAGEPREIRLLPVLLGKPLPAASILRPESPGTPVALVSSLDAGLSALSIVREDFVWKVLVARPVGQGFELVHERAVPFRTALVRDARSRVVVAYSTNPPGVAPLGPAGPDLPPAAPVEKSWIIDLTGAPACLDTAATHAAFDPMPENPEFQVHRRTVMLTPAEVDVWIGHVRREDAGGALVHGMQADQWRTFLVDRYADLPPVRLLSADAHARHGRWREVRDVLAPSSAESFPDADGAQHFCHLQALASLYLGETEEGRRWLAAARRHQGSCELDAVSAVLVPRPGPEERAPEGTGASLRLTELVWAVVDADAQLAALDAEGALATLDPKRFVTHDEIQVLARRVEAWLHVTPPPGPPRFGKIMTLALFVQAHAAPPWAPRTELPLPGARWDEAQLDDLARRAGAWLSAQPEKG